MKIFISHISEESSLALVLKDWIESTFGGTCSVFVSSDKDDIPAGADWFGRINEALTDSKVLIVLCSPASLSRPWINFETGCAWIKQIPIIPFCHSGQEKGKLPQPIARMQAIQIEDGESVSLLLSALAKELGFPKIPRIDSAAMRAELLAAVTPEKPVATSALDIQINLDEDVSPEMLKALTFLARLGDRERASVDELAAHLQVPHSRMKFIIDQLEARKLIYTSLSVLTGASYTLSKGGRQYLFDREML